MARAARGELAKIYGCLTYRFHRPRRPTSAIELVDLGKTIFKLQADPDANNVFRHAVLVNIEVLREIDSWCWKHFNTQYMHYEEFRRQEGQPDIGVRMLDCTFTLQVVEALQHWRAVLILEIGISETALKRLDTAKLAAPILRKSMSALTESEREENDKAMQALYAEWLLLRQVLISGITRVHQAIGDKEFFKRHRYELWDLVDARLED
ncbi:hypothetical protein A1O3_07555 [Capronia epimyces CBS 606.96]|uniref:Uncharacterized protein n=1 Tax=Capronia epimyces CBS 606.96 TaxID=1182542 RepID=W9XV87_9EURO|nr:uncharacterized protein A1O3_07555 [Capronia epimyces CBS 606.96]EXJ81265.1 hypothetical protein A1O3_07555 [Capronia epimyces CBS 606.96]